jgi:transcriptional regulator with XRE-family HTH domain
MNPACLIIVKKAMATTESKILELPDTEPHPAVVDATRVEQQIDEKLIGERIRAMRLRRSMGLVELGRLTGLSASFLSQLETGRVVPTIRNLARIALVFEKDLSCFFRQERKVKFRRLAKSDRIPITRKQKLNAKFVSESLGSLIPDRHIVPCLAEFLPNGDECEFTPKLFTGTEFVYVLDGRLDLCVTNQEMRSLETGDVCWIDASTPRQYLCHGHDTARALIVTEHPTQS